MSAKRANGKGSVAARVLTDGRTSYQAQAYVTDREGRYRRVTKSFRSESDAYAWIEKRAAERAVGQPGPHLVAPTVTEFGVLWLDKILANEVALDKIRPGTYEQYEWCWRVHIEPALGHLRLTEADLRPSVIRQWLVSKTAARTPQGRPYAPRTIEMMFMTLHRGLRDAVAEQYLSKNPLAGLKPPTTWSPKGQPLSRAEAGPFLAAALDGDTTTGALWATMTMLGLRIGEAMALRWDDIDFATKRIRISRTLTRHDVPDPTRPSGRRRVVLEGPTKTNASTASLPIPEPLVDRLSRHRRLQRRERAAAPTWADDGLVFTTSIGTHLDARNLARDLDTACAEVGIARHVRPHDLRHSMATLLLGKVDIRVLQSLMRHRHVETTAAIYARMTEDVWADTAGVVNDTFAGLMSAQRTPDPSRLHSPASRKQRAS